MRFTALACDYDGTLASGDRIGPEVLAALEGARGTGLRLILVTGRTFFDLTRVCERLDLFDGVVAENGGVLYFPPAGVLCDQAPPPPPRLTAELDRRGIPYQAGRVIVGVARGDEARVREALAATEVSLALIHNRAALMLLPPGVGKGTGIRQMIRDLGLSPHDVLALGDAENDLDLFEACDFSGCPGDAVPAVQERADWVFPGENGRAIAAAIAGPILDGALQVEGLPRHQTELGWAVATAERVAIPSRGVNILVLGDSGSGKSRLVGALAERLHEERYGVCIIDPEGDHQALGRLAGFHWAEVRDRGAMEEAVVRFGHDPGAGVVLDLAGLPHPDKVRLVEATLERLRDLRRRGGAPHWIVLDEAHYSLHREGIRETVLGLEDRGLCLVTYRGSWLRPSVIAGIDTLILARTTEPEELVFIRDLLGPTGEPGRRAVATLPDLPAGEFVLVSRRGHGELLTFAPLPRQTAHVRHLRKYADSRVAAGEQFLFRSAAGQVVATADSLGAFRQELGEMPEAVVAHHAARGDFSRWILDVFSDRALAGQIRKLEARRTRGEIRDLVPRIQALVTHRYGTNQPATP